MDWVAEHPFLTVLIIMAALVASIVLVCACILAGRWDRRMQELDEGHFNGTTQYVNTTWIPPQPVSDDPKIEGE